MKNIPYDDALEAVKHLRQAENALGKAMYSSTQAHPLIPIEKSVGKLRQEVLDWMKEYDA